MNTIFNTIFVFLGKSEAIEGLPITARHRKAEVARLNPQDVGAREDETLSVSTEGAKRPEDLATAARQ
ncbi:hypothetical protein [Alkalihalobacillus sp. CinArs1]|uniref:hypothetical protein n=1 Tax=Alkalihalobacillus sp. CinArs1 TaxID=2995314 RepID=UPI0022DD5428|nr:hypothetical protein [Alkalihalobacillus sp. CinArs1]